MQDRAKMYVVTHKEILLFVQRLGPAISSTIERLSFSRGGGGAKNVIAIMGNDNFGTLQTVFSMY